MRSRIKTPVEVFGDDKVENPDEKHEVDEEIESAIKTIMQGIEDGGAFTEDRWEIDEDLSNEQKEYVCKQFFKKGWGVVFYKPLFNMNGWGFRVDYPPIKGIDYLK